MDKQNGKHTRRYSTGAKLAAGLALFCVTYWNTFVWLWQRSTAPDSYYSHALMIPFISGYLIWRRREALLRSTGESSVVGPILILFALSLHLLSVALNVYFSSGLSIFIFAGGFSLYFFGWSGTRKIVFPLGFLIFMFPLPRGALGAISVPMKLFAIWCSTGIVSLLGVPVVREGFQLHFSSASLEIGNPCSGLRSLLALTALGSLMAHFFTGPMWKRVALFAVSLPIALLCNTLRMVALSLVADSFGSDAATGAFHDASGIFMYGVALILLFGTGRILAWRLPKTAGK
jgi:exosortase